MPCPMTQHRKNDVPPSVGSTARVSCSPAYLNLLNTESLVAGRIPSTAILLLYYVLFIVGETNKGTNNILDSIF